MKMVIKKQLLKNLVTEYSNKKNNISNHENNTQNRDYANLKKLLSIPNNSPKAKRELKKMGKILPSFRGKIYNKFFVKRIS